MKLLHIQDDSLHRISKYLQVVCLSLLLMYFGKTLLVPLVFGLLIAMIMYPVCRLLEQRHWRRSLAIAVLMSFIIILFLVILWLLGYELNIFLQDIPLITNKFKSYSPGIRDWLRDHAGIAVERQSDWGNKIMQNLQNGLTGSLSRLLMVTMSSLFMLLMIPIYASLFLYHRATFVRFLEAALPVSFRERLRPLLINVVLTYYHFVRGTFFVYLVVGALNSAGLLLLGIRHAILYGVLTAFMTIIPYVGIVISASIPITIALITKDSLWYPFGVILIFTFVQYLEANIIFPKIVGKQLDLSTWSTLVAIIAGGLVWGVSGMILFIPLTAIFKLISDQAESLKPINILLNRKDGFGESEKPTPVPKEAGPQANEYLKGS